MSLLAENADSHGRKSVHEIGKAIIAGKKISVRRDRSGNNLIKLNVGPFGLISKRYVLDEQSMGVLYQQYNLKRG